METRLKQLSDRIVKDDVITFEQLGVDKLFIDEADMFKNLGLSTKMRNISGVSANTKVQKTQDLYMKCQYIDELTGGKGIVFATGTPVSNSISEIFTMQRYLQADLLRKIISLILTHGPQALRKRSQSLNLLLKARASGRKQGLQDSITCLSL